LLEPVGDLRGPSEKHNHVTLDPVMKDSQVIPAVRID
jgi:hypothetical protein